MMRLLMTYNVHEGKVANVHEGKVACEGGLSLF